MRVVWAGWTLFLTVLLIVLPTALGRIYMPSFRPEPAPMPTPAPKPEPAPAVTAEPDVTIFIPANQQLITIPLGEYVIRVVAGELSPSFADEALKAQTVAARTYAVNHLRSRGGRGCALHPEADACATPAAGQAYLDLPALENKLGKNEAALFLVRLKRAEAATRGLIITYAGRPIEAVYHSASGETTDTAAAEWGIDLPYLQPVPDPWGKSAPKYTERMTFSPADLARALGVSTSAALAATGQPPITVLELTPGGRAAKVQVGGQIFSGRDFRTRLGLRSARFTSALTDGKIVITTYGYGHGVGMSQHGADGMARAGYDYRQILEHYYPGTAVSDLNAVSKNLHLWT